MCGTCTHPDEGNGGRTQKALKTTRIALDKNGIIYIPGEDTIRTSRPVNSAR